MSWDGWVDSLMCSQTMSKAVIAGKGGDVWACSKEHGTPHVSVDEVKKIASICKGDCHDMSVCVEGKKYLVTKVDKEETVSFMQFKALKEDEVEHRKISGTAAVTNQAVIIGLDKDENSKANLSKNVTGVAINLASSGY